MVPCSRQVESARTCQSVLHGDACGRCDGLYGRLNPGSAAGGNKGYDYTTEAMCLDKKLSATA